MLELRKHDLMMLVTVKIFMIINFNMCINV